MNHGNELARAVWELVIANQVNIRAGELPPIENSGIRYLTIFLNAV
jgi:hypothetical protein